MNVCRGRTKHGTGALADPFGLTVSDGNDPSHVTLRVDFTPGTFFIARGDSQLFRATEPLARSEIFG